MVIHHGEAKQFMSEVNMRNVGRTKNGGQNDDNVGNAGNANSRHAGNGRHDGRHRDSRNAHLCAHWCFGDSGPSAADHFSDQKDSNIKSKGDDAMGISFPERLVYQFNNST